jgi:hypothetical protein
MTKIYVLAILIGTTTLALAEDESNESIEEKKFWKKETEYVNKEIESAGKRCDTEFAFEWIDKPKLRSEAERSKYTPYGICSNMVKLVEATCRNDEDAKAAVKKKIKTIKCGYAKPRKLDLKAGTLTYMGNNEEANMWDWGKPALEKKL